MSVTFNTIDRITSVDFGKVKQLYRDHAKSISSNDAEYHENLKSADIKADATRAMYDKYRNQGMDMAQAKNKLKTAGYLI